MEAAEALDPDAAMAELRDAMDAAAREVSDTTLGARRAGAAACSIA
jgi:hypothetical protein